MQVLKFHYFRLQDEYFFHCFVISLFLRASLDRLANASFDLDKGSEKTFYKKIAVNSFEPVLESSASAFVVAPRAFHRPFLSAL